MSANDLKSLISPLSPVAQGEGVPGRNNPRPGSTPPPNHVAQSLPKGLEPFIETLAWVPKMDCQKDFILCPSFGITVLVLLEVDSLRRDHFGLPNLKVAKSRQVYIKSS